MAWAERDGLCAAQLWFHHWTGADLFTWPCVQLLRPDGSKYPSARAESWDGFPGVPQVESDAALLGPLVEADWGETLTAARECT